MSTASWHFISHRYEFNFNLLKAHLEHLPQLVRVCTRAWTTSCPPTLLARYTYEPSVELVYILLDCNSSADKYLKQNSYICYFKRHQPILFCHEWIYIVCYSYFHYLDISTIYKYNTHDRKFECDSQFFGKRGHRATMIHICTMKMCMHRYSFA
jgi:hypothetical protein